MSRSIIFVLMYHRHKLLDLIHGIIAQEEKRDILGKIFFASSIKLTHNS
jgi:hypothetical protein